MKIVTLSLLTICLAPAHVSAADDPGSAPDTKALLQSIVSHEFQPPAGRSPRDLMPDLTRALASPDPQLRDDLAFTILTAWIYEKRLLGPDELRGLIEKLLANLRSGIGQQNTDEVFVRSFSALTLSVVVARDNAEPFLREDEFRRLFDAALNFFADERDTRGFDPTKGWIHTVAHTSDLLKFLARSRYVRPADQGRLLDALAAKLRAAPEVFGQGEDERMARVVISLVRRPDLDENALRAFLDGRKIDGKFPEKPTLDNLRLLQNTHHLLTSLWSVLSVDDRPFEHSESVTKMMRDTLGAVLQ
jgi:hypothetical protein